MLGYLNMATAQAICWCLINFFLASMYKDLFLQELQSNTKTLQEGGITIYCHFKPATNT